jgi:signal peptidase I
LYFLIYTNSSLLGTWKLYLAAGRKSWEAAIPVYNAIVLLKIIGRPTWWTLLLFIPINLIMFPVIWMKLEELWEKIGYFFLAIVTFGLYIIISITTKKNNYKQEKFEL